MSQNAMIKEILPGGIVRISLMRQLECSMGCKSCDGCTAKPTQELIALASDPVGTKAGDYVEVESTGAGTITVALLVYLLPCLALLAGYGVGAYALGLGEGLSISLGFVTFFLGFIPAKLLDMVIRGRKAPEFVVLGYKTPMVQ